MESPPNKKKETTPQKEQNISFITVLLTTFTTVFVAELGDKTQLATLLLSAQSGRPLIVFIGAALALISSSLVGVLVGSWLSKILPPEKFQQISGILFILLGIWLGLNGLSTLDIRLTEL